MTCRFFRLINNVAVRPRHPARPNSIHRSPPYLIFPLHFAVRPRTQTSRWPLFIGLSPALFSNSLHPRPSPHTGIIGPFSVACLEGSDARRCSTLVLGVPTLPRNRWSEDGLKVVRLADCPMSPAPSVVTVPVPVWSTRSNCLPSRI